jgi:flagellar hook-associated protein 3 FlgL
MLAVSGATDIGTLSQTTANTELIQQRIDQLTEETSTGFISQTYDGLGSGAPQALNLTAQLAQNTTLQANVSQATTIASETQTVLGQIQTLASSFAQSITTELTSGASSAGAVATTARNTLSEIVGLLNTQVGDTYIFAGQDSSNPPIPDAGNITSSAFYTAISTAVANLSSTGAAAVETATLAASQSGSATSPFSSTLEASNTPATVDLGGGQFVQTGVLADQNSDAVSTGVGTTSTGSYIRDLLRGLATVGSLSSAQANDTDFEPLLQNTLTSVQNATTALSTDIAGLGARQDRLTAATSDLTDTATALTTQLSNVQDTNVAQVATELSTAQTQLQASYQIIASLDQLSLAKFLPAS